MTRHNNIVLTYLIVEKYNQQMERAILPIDLLTYIIRKTGVTKLTARCYIDDLKRGIFIEGKQYKIKSNEGGIII